MEMPSNIEFYTFNDEAWLHFADGTAEKLTEAHSDIISAIYEMIEQFYPGALAALKKEYERCIPNMSFYRYRIVVRFIKCNFGNIDKTADIDSFGRIHLECVPCPLRGECRLENVVCRPEFAHNLSDVARILVYIHAAVLVSPHRFHQIVHTTVVVVDYKIEYPSDLYRVPERQITRLSIKMMFSEQNNRKNRGKSFD